MIFLGASPFEIKNNNRPVFDLSRSKKNFTVSLAKKRVVGSSLRKSIQFTENWFESESFDDSLEVLR